MSLQNKIGGISACVLDAYGPLFDVHSAVGKHRDRLGEKAGQVSVLWRPCAMGNTPARITALLPVVHPMAWIMKVIGYAKAEFPPPETVAKTMTNFIR